MRRSDYSNNRRYKGWIIKRTDAIQVGHRLPSSNSILEKLGIGTHRNVSGYELRAPDGYVKFCDTLKQAYEYIDNY